MYSSESQNTAKLNSLSWLFMMSLITKYDIFFLLRTKYIMIYYVDYTISKRLHIISKHVGLVSIFLLTFPDGF